MCTSSGAYELNHECAISKIHIFYLRIKRGSFLSSCIAEIHGTVLEYLTRTDTHIELILLLYHKIITLASCSVYSQYSTSNIVRPQC